MDKKLIDLSTKELLEKFGAGEPKPGSGSGAALQGMLAAKLICTVIILTTDEKRKSKYKKFHSDFEAIRVRVNNFIYPELMELFQKDSTEFGEVIKLRNARDEENNLFQKEKIKKELERVLKVVTEIPIKIAKLCVELSDFAEFIFKNGFRSARGDSNVALNSAASSVAGCLSIINLNLLSLGEYENTEKLISDAKTLKIENESILLKVNICGRTLELEAEEEYLFKKELNAFRSDRWVDLNLSYSDIEDKARQLQLFLWRRRDRFWKNGNLEDPLGILKPEVVLKKVLGYQFNNLTTLGQHELNGEYFDIAGIIDKTKKSVSVSGLFPIQTQNFTAAHELGHALFHKQDILHRDKALDGSSSQNHRDIKELQADKFAACFLMPKKQVEDIFQNLFLTRKFVINTDTVFALGEKKVSTFKNKYKNLRGLSKYLASAEFFKLGSFKSMADIFQVSVETMAIRLEELDLVEY